MEQMAIVSNMLSMRMANGSASRLVSASQNQDGTPKCNVTLSHFPIMGGGICSIVEMTMAREVSDLQLSNRTILLSGGTGSFGQKLVEIALPQNPKAIRIFSRGEFLQSEMQKRFSNGCLRYFIGDIRDLGRLKRAMDGCDIVIHAAALKRIESCEYNPIEAVRTNIDGAANIVDAALDCGVDKVMAISTDKAVHPVNLYGATKMVMEKLLINANAYGGYSTKFSCVRYGNVIGSRGSVVPLFREQSKTGTVTITHPDMTRFWLTLEQGVRFVIDCLGRMKGGEIFVPKIPSMKITALAEAIAPDCEHKIIGLRPGEKLHEVLITEDERATDCGDYYVLDGTANTPDGFRYASNENCDWVTVNQLEGMI
jgi:UDP-N-acetylglucosamine 4,6-dehydratase (inverting)